MLTPAAGGPPAAPPVMFVITVELPPLYGKANDSLRAAILPPPLKLELFATDDARCAREMLVAPVGVVRFTAVMDHA